MKKLLILIAIISTFAACKKDESPQTTAPKVTAKLSLTGTKWTKYGVDTTTFTEDSFYYTGAGKAVYAYTLKDSMITYATIRIYTSGKWQFVTPVFNTGKAIFPNDSMYIWNNYPQHITASSLSIIGARIH